jgi:hypothetical protein
MPHLGVWGRAVPRFDRPTKSRAVLLHSASNLLRYRDAISFKWAWGARAELGNRATHSKNKQHDLRKSMVATCHCCTASKTAQPSFRKVTRVPSGNTSSAESKLHYAPVRGKLPGPPRPASTTRERPRRRVCTRGRSVTNSRADRIFSEVQRQNQNLNKVKSSDTELGCGVDGCGC